MLLNDQQVKERLHIGDAKLLQLREEKKLVPVNPKKEGAKKWFRRYASKDVEAVRRELASNGQIHPRTVKSVVVVPDSPVKGVLTRLESIESKLDVLIAMWK